jgi:hypothetical protein
LVLLLLLLLLLVLAAARRARTHQGRSLTRLTAPLPQKQQEGRQQRRR